MATFGVAEIRPETHYQIDITWGDTYTGTSSVSGIEIIRYGAQSSKTDEEMDEQLLALFDRLQGLDIVQYVSLRRTTAGQVATAAVEA